MNAQASTRLVIKDLAIHFAGVRAVDDVSLEVQPGEFFSLLGPSGCGKTTLLRTIAGFYRQNGGSIHFNDTRIDHVPAHKRDTGMVFQHYAIFPHLDVWQNVAYGLRTRPGTKEEKAERVREALELVDLTGLERRKPRQLSGGQQQRVAVARAIVIRPRLLLMDEPLANLDAKLRVRLRTDLRTLQKRLGITTIYVTHDQEEALSLSDRIAVMFNGHVHQVGTPAEIYGKPNNRKVAEFVGEGNYLAGTVSDIQGGIATVALSAGGQLRAGVTDGAGLVGCNVFASFRQHSPRLLPHGGVHGDADLSGTLLRRSYLGDTIRYEVDLGAGSLTTEQFSSAGSLIEEGALVRIELAPDAVTLFDDEGTRVG